MSQSDQIIIKIVSTPENKILFTAEKKEGEDKFRAIASHKDTGKIFFKTKAIYSTEEDAKNAAKEIANAQRVYSLDLKIK